MAFSHNPSVCAFWTLPCEEIMGLYPTCSQDQEALCPKLSENQMELQDKKLWDCNDVVGPLKQPWNFSRRIV